MNIKVKAIIAGLLSVAVISVFYFVKPLRELALSTISVNIPATQKVNYDKDNDGLIDKHEGYWMTDPLNPDTDGDGYLDGEEVAAGRNPLIPAPNDLLDDSNLSDKFSEMTAIGIIEGSLKVDSPVRDENIANINLAIMEEAIAIFESKYFRTEIKEVGNSPKNIEKYFYEISEPIKNLYILYYEELLSIKKAYEVNGAIDFGSTDVMAGIEDFSFRSAGIFSRLSSISVPSSLVEAHQPLLRLAANIDGMNTAMAQAQRDPVKAILAINRIASFDKVFSSAVLGISDLAAKSGVNLRGTIFQK